MYNRDKEGIIVTTRGVILRRRSFGLHDTKHAQNRVGQNTGALPSTMIQYHKGSTPSLLCSMLNTVNDLNPWLPLEDVGWKQRLFSVADCMGF